MNKKKVSSPIFMDKDVENGFLTFHGFPSIPDKLKSKILTYFNLFLKFN